MTETQPNTSLPTHSTEDVVTFRPIGHVENNFDAPASPERIHALESRIVLDPALADGLQGLTQGAKIMVLFHFHRSEGYELLQHPRGDTSQPRRGVFALRTPHRPNGIGVTVVDLIEVEGHVLHVEGLDALNGTPVLDIKPA